MTVRPFVHSPFATNSYVCHSGGEAVVVDASCSTPHEVDELTEYIREQGLTVRHLLLTHAHLDHIFGCAALAEQFNLDWTAHRDTLPFLRRAREQSIFFGQPIAQPPEPGRLVVEGDTIRFGSAEWDVLETPGHAPGSISILDRAAGIVFVGDVLFRQSIGRTDLPGGDMGTLMDSIYQKLLTLPDATRVLSGHGPETTIGAEHRFNPFLR